MDTTETKSLMTYDENCCYRGCDECTTYHKDRTGTTTISGLPRLSQDEANAFAEKLGLSLSETIALSLQDTMGHLLGNDPALTEAARERNQMRLLEAVTLSLDALLSMLKRMPSSGQAEKELQDRLSIARTSLASYAHHLSKQQELP